MEPQRKVYFNGKFVAESEARVSIFDSALMFGDMVFDMTRSFNGKPFRLREHLERIYAGLKLLEIDCGMTLEQIEAATLETIEVNRDYFPPGLDFQIMHDISRGPLPVYHRLFPEGTGPTVSINLSPLTWHIGPLADLYTTGVHAIIPPQRSVPARLIEPKIKNRSRIYYQVATLQAKKVDPAGWALLTDEDGFLTEGGGANIFLVKQGELATPEGRNILRGVTRHAIMELSARIGLTCRERNLEPYDLMTADEAFFTSTPYTLLPITRFNGMQVGNGQPGPITQRLVRAWSEMVDVDIVAQARDYARRLAEEHRS